MLFCRKSPTLIKKYSFILACIIGLTGNQLYADTEQMNNTLSRIDHVLSQLNPLINEAESEQDKNARVQFNYEALRQDLDKIRTGITQQLHQVSIEPRQVQPLAGDYLDG